MDNGLGILMDWVLIRTSPYDLIQVLRNLSFQVKLQNGGSVTQILWSISSVYQHHHRQPAMAKTRPGTGWGGLCGVGTTSFFLQFSSQLSTCNPLISHVCPLSGLRSKLKPISKLSTPKIGQRAIHTFQAYILKMSIDPCLVELRNSW